MREDSSLSPRQPRSSTRLHMMLSGGSPQLTQEQPRQQLLNKQQQQQHRQQQQKQQQQARQQRKAPEPLRRAVADCLSASHHASLPPLASEPVRTLQDYLSNPSTIHFAYVVLLEHALAERDRSPPVVIKCVSLLKRYLFRYVPPVTTLQQIDGFCASLINECNAAAGKRTTPSAPPPTVLPTASVFVSEPLVKSLTYVRAVVARHLPGFSLRQSSHSLKIQPVPLSPRNRLLSAHYGANGIQPPVGDDKEFARPTPAAIMLAVASIDDENSDDFIAADVLNWRWIVRKGRQMWMPSPVMTDSGGIARPNVENLDYLEQGLAIFWLRTNADKTTDEGKPSHVLRASTAAAIAADTAAVKSHLRDVAVTKRQPITRWGTEPSSTMRKRPRPLFQYRCYTKQQPLRLSDADIEEVIAAVCAEATSPNLALAPAVPGNNTANVACSVLIKLLIDMYLADARTAAPLTLSILQVMLSAGPVAVRIRAFDLVLNLGVHAHLLEPVQSEDQDNSHLFPTERAEHGTPRAVGIFESWLLTILCEMMLFLVQWEEKEEGVWAAAVSCLLYLVCDRGRIRRDRLENFDFRIFRTLLDISRDNAWAEEIHSRLIRILSNLLYDVKHVDSSEGGAVFDLERLETIGGIELICKEYGLATSPEVKRNLFAIIFEYLLCDLRCRAEFSGKKFPNQDEVQAIATALVLAGSPDSLSIAFRHKLNGVGGKLSKSICKALDRDISTGRLNAMVLEEVAKSIDILIDKYGTLDEELREMLSIILADESQEDVSRVPYLETRAWAILQLLLHSSRSDYRQRGYSWLNQLLATEVECLHSRQEGVSHRHCMFKFLEQAKIDLPDKKPSAVHLLFGLLKSKSHYVRQGFLVVLERFLSQCQRLGCTDDTSTVSDGIASTLVWLLSGSLWQFITTNDTNRINVLKMCNLLLSQICIRWTPASKLEDKKSSSPVGREMVVVSSMATLFLREEAAASEHMVTKMPTALFYWPLMQLAGATMDDMTLAIAVGSKGGGNVPGCASDVRAALLLLLVGKCTIQQAALEEVGGEEFFRSLLDDRDARIAYFTASFLIKRMMVEDADNYQRVLQNLVFKAQQKNDEKLLENPYLQMGGILQLGPDIKAQVSIQDET